MHLADPDEDKEQTTIVEGVLLPRSPLIGQSLRSLEFKERYGLQVLAIHRAGRVPHSISSARLRMGDVLLLQGTPENVKALERGNLFNIFGGVEKERLNRSRAPLAAAIFALAILAATFKLASLPVAMLTRRVLDAADPVPVARGGLPAGGMEGADSDRRAAFAWGGHGGERSRQVSRPAADRSGRRGQPLCACSPAFSC